MASVSWTDSFHFSAKVASIRHAQSHLPVADYSLPQQVACMSAVALEEAWVYEHLAGVPMLVPLWDFGCQSNPFGIVVASLPADSTLVREPSLGDDSEPLVATS